MCIAIRIEFGQAVEYASKQGIRCQIGLMCVRVIYSTNTGWADNGLRAALRRKSWELVDLETVTSRFRKEGIYTW